MNNYLTAMYLNVSDIRLNTCCAFKYGFVLLMHILNSIVLNQSLKGDVMRLKCLVLLICLTLITNISMAAGKSEIIMISDNPILTIYIDNIHGKVGKYFSLDLVLDTSRKPDPEWLFGKNISKMEYDCTSKILKSYGPKLYLRNGNLYQDNSVNPPEEEKDHTFHEGNELYPFYKKYCLVEQSKFNVKDVEVLIDKHINNCDLDAFKKLRNYFNSNNELSYHGLDLKEVDINDSDEETYWWITFNTPKDKFILKYPKLDKKKEFKKHKEFNPVIRVLDVSDDNNAKLICGWSMPGPDYDN